MPLTSRAAGLCYGLKMRHSLRLVFGALGLWRVVLCLEAGEASGEKGWLAGY